MAASDSCIITCAVSGAVANKDQCAAIPYTPEEYAAEVRRARDAGASMVHIHARTPVGIPSVDPADYRAITQAILAETPDIVINYSTGWVGLPMAERVGHITQLKPEIGALNMGSMNYARYSSKRKAFVFNFVFENHFDDIVFLLRTMQEAGVKPECECFDVGHVESVGAPAGHGRDERADPVLADPRRARRDRRDRSEPGAHVLRGAARVHMGRDRGLPRAMDDGRGVGLARRQRTGSGWRTTSTSRRGR